MKRTLLFVVTIFIVGLCSCSGKKTTTEVYEPYPSFPMEELNSSFRIINPNINNNSLRNGEILLLELENLTEKPIIFPGDFNLRAYQKNESKWVGIQNNFSNSQGDWVLPTKQEWRSGLGLDLIPYIPGLIKPTTIRIVAFGKNENSEGSVGAYIDLPLYP
jgi:hypothetical protein